MAEQVAAALAEVPETKKALVTRDPSHCLDLGLKGLGEARGLHQETARRCKQTRPVLEHGPDRGHSGGDGGRRSGQIPSDQAAPGHAHVPGGGHGRWNCRGALLVRGLAPGPPLREVLRVAHCR